MRECIKKKRELIKWRGAKKVTAMKMPRKKQATEHYKGLLKGVIFPTLYNSTAASPILWFEGGGGLMLHDLRLISQSDEGSFPLFGTSVGRFGF